MTHKLVTSDRDFEQRFAGLVEDHREVASDVRESVSEIIAAVQRGGDKAVRDYTLKFDRCDLDKFGIKLTAGEIKAARQQVDVKTLQALELAAQRIHDFHAKQLPTDLNYTDNTGVALGYRWTPIDAVGIYVPGGTASYPSSVLMNALPARVAGVARIAMTVPTPDGQLNPLVLAAADIAGVDEIYRIGGAQAIAALAYGTQSIAAVAKVTGPGNAYVAEAKRQVFGVVGIDMIAGPSEILVVADSKNDPHWIAADLLSQAEHDANAQSILICDDAEFVKSVEVAIEAQLAELARSAIAGESWNRHGVIILVTNLKEAPALINRLAPEHLLLAVDDPQALFTQVTHAGSVFLGRMTPEAIGDYLAGPNHVLPTGRRARFSSGLGVTDFMKRTTFLGCNESAMTKLGPSAVALAQAEGLPAHALSVTLRLGKSK